MKKRDGEYHFDAVEAFYRDHFAKEHEAQFLALCPLCAAMYNEFVKHDEGAMESLKNTLMSSEDAKVPLQLGELNTSVRFVESHWSDIRTILQEMGYIGLQPTGLSCAISTAPRAFYPPSVAARQGAITRPCWPC